MQGKSGHHQPSLRAFNALQAALKQQQKNTSSANISSIFPRTSMLSNSQPTLTINRPANQSPILGPPSEHLEAVSADCALIEEDESSFCLNNREKIECAQSGTNSRYMSQLSLFQSVTKDANMMASSKNSTNVLHNEIKSKPRNNCELESNTFNQLSQRSDSSRGLLSSKPFQKLSNSKNLPAGTLCQGDFSNSMIANGTVKPSNFTGISHLSNVDNRPNESSTGIYSQSALAPITRIRQPPKNLFNTHPIVSCSSISAAASLLNDCSRSTAMPVENFNNVMGGNFETPFDTEVYVDNDARSNTNSTFSFSQFTALTNQPGVSDRVYLATNQLETSVLVHDTNARSTLSIHSSTASSSNPIPNSPSVPLDQETVLTSACYSVAEGKVTSMVITRDGAYCMAGFSNGTIRLFDLTTSGNCDPDDRFGYVLGRVDGSSTHNSMTVQLQLVEEEISTHTRAHQSIFGCCHLFSGVVQGSSRMIAIDIRGLRDMKRRRGFITGRGAGIQRFANSDTKLRGLLSVTTVSLETLENDREDCLPGYAVTYRLLCGKAYGIYHVWEVKFCARYSDYRAKQLVYNEEWIFVCSANVSAPCLGYACLVTATTQSVLQDLFAWGAPNLSQYSDSQDSIRGENIMSCFGDVEDSNLSAPNLHLIKDATVTNSNSTSQKSANNNAIEQFEILFLPVSKELRTNIVTYKENEVKTHKSKIVSGCGKIPALSNVFCASRDGTIIFSGLDELVVCKYMPSVSTGDNSTPGMGSVVAYEAYSLSNLAGSSKRSVSSAHGSTNGGVDAGKRQRHLRQISSISCTSDGSFALVLCSDNCVLLYSLCDVFECGFPPQECHVNPYAIAHSRDNQGDSNLGYQWTSIQPIGSQRQLGNSKSAGVTGSSEACGGYITTLFQAYDTIKLEIHISNVCGLTASETGCPCRLNATSRHCRRPHSSPMEVQIGLSWWLIASPALGGVVKLSRLADKNDASGAVLKKSNNGTSSSCCTPQSRWKCASIAPPCLAVPGVGANKSLGHPTQEKFSVHSSFRNSNSTKCICGDEYTLHWRGVNAQPWVNDVDIMHANHIQDKLVAHTNQCDTVATTETSIAANSGKKSETKRELLSSDEQQSKKRSKLKTDNSGTQHISTVSLTSSITKLQNESNLSRTGDFQTKKCLPQIEALHSANDKYHNAGKNDHVEQNADSKRNDSYHDVEALRRRVQDLEEIAQELESAFLEARAEAEYITRKSDYRRQVELDFRRKVKSDQEAMQAEREAQQAALSQAQRQRDRAITQHMQLNKLCQPIVEFCSNDKLLSSPQLGLSSNLHSPLNSSTLSLFCVVCQAKTADTVLLNCGHVCLCSEHAQTMFDNDNQFRCPVCKQRCDRVCKLR